MPKLLIIILWVSCYYPVLSQPIAQFSADKTVGCGPLVVHFTNQTTGASATASYQWNFGTGNVSADLNPEAVFTQPGNYFVVLTVQDGGQSSTASRTITVDQPPAVSFTVFNPKVCSPTPVGFNATATPGSGAIASYLWDFGDGNTQSVTSAETAHVYTAGTFGVSLTATDIYGCAATQSRANLVTVLPQLSASFQPNPQTLCTVNSPVTFTNTSVGPGTLSYQWNFGDGNTSTQTSPAHTYGVKGTYTVILIVNSSAGCVASDTQTNVLNVANFQSDITVPPTICQGATVIFGDSSNPVPSGSVWAVNGVAQGSGNSLSYTFTQSGTPTIQLTNSFGICTQSVTKTVTVNSAPAIVPFSIMQQSACGAPMTVDFLDHTPGAVQWAWVFDLTPYPYQNITYGGPAISTVYGENDDYAVQLTVTNAQGCTASEMQSIDVTSPYVTITLVNGPPESCGMAMTQTFGSAQISELTSYMWYFGDGDSSSAGEPTHTFTTPGYYQTYLKYTTAGGCSGVSNTWYTVISSPLHVDFTADTTTVCVGQPVTFGGPSLLNDSALVTSWDFGDGSPNTFGQTGAYHVYNAPGIYTVMLHVANPGECYQVVVKNNYITVLSSPTISLVATPSCNGRRDTVNFTVAAGGGATQLFWNFGDGTVDTTSAAVTSRYHIFTSNQSYTVTVTASNGVCQQPASQLVTVEQEPQSVSLFTDTPFGTPDTSVCPGGMIWTGLSVQTGNSQDTYYPQGTPTWQYGDSSFFQGTTLPTGTYPDAGAYYYTLLTFKAGESGLRAIVPDDNGCPDTSNWINLRVGGVNAGYDIVQDDQCYQQPVLLQDTSKANPNDPIVSWLWNFGDGTTSAQSGMVSHLYSSPGTYTVELTVQDQDGCSSSSPTAVSQVTVDGPEAAFTAIGGPDFPQGVAVQFSNGSNTSNTVNTQYSWNFGDGSTSNQINPDDVYGQPGVYTVTLTAQDGTTGCVSSISQTITVQVINTAFSKTAAYVAAGSCPPVLVQFTNTSLNYTSFTWNFGDGETVSNIPDPSHVYQKPGTYIVTLTVLSDNGQTTTMDSVIVIQPTAVLSASVPDVCVGQSVQLQSTGNQRVKNYSWDFGDGTVVPGTDSTASHVYATAGMYTTRLVVTDSVGCAVAATATDAIDVHPPPVVGMTPPAAMVCLGQGVTIGANGGATYSWSPGATLNDSTVSAPLASPVVGTEYTVTVADDNGCMNSDSVFVAVVRPDTVSVSPDSTAICPGKTAPLEAFGAANYRWIGITGGLSATDIANPVARPDSSTMYKVVGSDAKGCFADTLTVVVTVLAQPMVSAGPDLEVQGQAPVTIQAQGSSNIVTWLWTPATDLSCTSCQQPVCTPRQSEIYTVTVTAEDGCAASDTVTVQLECDEAKIYIPDAFTPNGDGHNDRWRILGAISEVNHLVIFDRWGAKVFEQDHFFPADPGSGWDGTMKGQPEPAGVYVYFVEMQCPRGAVFTRKGTVVLVR